MSRVAKAVALVSATKALTGDAQASEGSMSKVIAMLQDMKAKVTEEKNAEQIAFSKFQEWCKNGDAELKSEIAKDGEEIESLTASIAQGKDQAKNLGGEIAKLESDISSYTADKEAADKQREKDHTEFLAEEKDYSESVDAVERAIDALSKEDYDRPAAAAALLQVNDKGGSSLPAKAKSIVAAFAEMLDNDKDDGNGGLDYAAPEANAYEFQSGGVINLLKKLLDEFRGKLAERQKEEMNSKHAYDMVVQDLTDSVAAAEKDISEKKTAKARKEETAAAEEKQLSATVAEKAASEDTLANMDTECSEKKLSFEEKQQLRTEEIEAISKATEILAAPDVADVHTKHFSFAQMGSKTSLVQRSSGKQDASSPRRKVRDFLEAEGKRLHSQGLNLLAEKIAADPFAKVKKMIDSMITRLLEEAKADADHEGFCDKEMGKSKITRTKLQEDIDSLAAAMESGKSTILHRTDRIATNSKDVSELETSMAEATEMRTAEKNANAATVKEAQVAQEKVQAATAVLKDFYERAGSTTALVQAKGASAAKVAMKSRGPKMGSDEWNALANPDYEGEGGFAVGIESSKVDKGHKAGMQTFGEQYSGDQDGAGGVMALLEVILSDFAGLEADTTAAETSAQKTYEEFMTKAKKDKAVKEKQIEMDTADKTTAEGRLQEDTADWKATQDELLAAERYHAKLVPQCIDPGQTFEERTASRESEIASLKEALKILGNPDIETSA